MCVSCFRNLGDFPQNKEYQEIRYYSYYNLEKQPFAHNEKRK